MLGRMISVALGLTLASCSTVGAQEGGQTAAVSMQQWAETCEPWDEWDKPAPPYKIHGNTYYVGTCGIGAIVIARESGHILIDTGTERGAEVVLANIVKLGFSPKEVKFLLHSHEHFDHVGGMASMEEETDAQIYVSPEAAITLMITGEPGQEDPQYGLHDAMRTVSKVMILKGKGQVWDEQVDAYFLEAGIELWAARTPGHSPGALSWYWKDCERDVCKSIVYADSLSPVSADGYKFSDHPEYVAEFRAGIARIAKLDCDILLTPHPSHSKMVKRAATGTLEGGMNCAEYGESKTRALDARLAKEAEEKAKE